jgi:hypothetical protein
MAMIACKECGHQISDQAASCPSCGAPAARPSKPRRLRRALYTILMTLAALWLVGATLWIVWTMRASNEPLSAASDQSADQPPAPNLPAPTSRAVPISESSPSQPPPSEAPVPVGATAASGPIYQTTAEQLYQDYSANGVATQSRIGSSRIRVTGTVSAIDEDAEGRAVVELSTGTENSADMTLGTNQTAAAAQLVKGESVDIECDRMQRILAAPRGRDCALVLVDARSKQVYLGVFLANDAGAAPIYIVGPMPESACRSRSDSISAQLSRYRRGDRVDLEDCGFATRESVPVGGCRLASFAAAAPEMPTAHLWRYDCAPAGTTVQRQRVAAESPVVRAASSPAEVSPAESAHQEIAADSDDQQVPAPTVAAAGPTPRGITTQGITAQGITAQGITAQGITAQGITAQGITAQAATAQGTGAAHLTLASATTSPQAASASAPTAAEDDLAAVRAADPQAARHIAAYCESTSVATADRVTHEAECRRNELEAWTRLVLHDEFPALDDATRHKCSEAPFPDSYVAKEVCAKYELHLD